jgi:hypothetical protein
MGRISLLAVVLAVVLVGDGAAIGGRVASPFDVRSTLDGITILPGRIQWVGTPGIPASQVESVAFLIDGKIRWVERKPPYTFSDDGGYLVTTWLSPGKHRFSVRARANDGRTATDTVVARVQVAPTPPAALAGRWQRSVSKSEARDQAPAGVWTLTFDRRWVKDKSPGKWDPVTSQSTGAGGIVDSYWVPGPRTFVVSGSVTTRILHDTDAEGGWWCEPGGPKATYSWSVKGDTLTLSPVGGHDACADRGSIWAGTWTRAQ